MLMKNSYRNRPCKCGSGKKYKKCCLRKDRSWQRFLTKMKKKEVPFRVEVSDPEGTGYGLEVMSEFTPGKNAEFKPDIKLETGTVLGWEGVPSKATLSIPRKGPRIASIDAEGNAGVSVVDGSETLTPKIKNLKKLKAKSRNGLFAVARIGKQRDAGILFFDVIFGLVGEAENKQEGHGKNRPHIAIYPSGNGKFFRLAEYKCKITSRMNYDLSQQLVVPTRLEVECELTNEVLLLDFSIDQTENACYLERIFFNQGSQ